MNDILKNGALYTIGSILTQFSSILVSIYFMKVFSVSQYGAYIFILSIGSVSFGTIDNCVTQIFLSRLSQSKSKFTETSKWQFLVLITAIILYCSLLLFIGIYNWNLLRISAIILGAPFLQSIFRPTLLFFVHEERRSSVFLKDVVLATVKCSFIGLFFLFHPSFYVSVSINLISVASVTIYLFRLRSRNGMGPLFTNATMKDSLEYIKSTWLLALLTLINYSYNRAQVFIIEAVKGFHVLGVFTGASQFVYPLMFVSSAFSAAVYPKLTKLSSGGDIQEFERITKFSCSTMAFVGVLISTVLFMLFPIINNILFSGKYINSTEVFRIMIWIIPIIFYYSTISNALVALGRVHLMVYVNIVALLFMIVIGGISLQRFSVNGVAVVTVVTELAILAFYRIVFSSVLIKEREAWRASQL